MKKTTKYSLQNVDAETFYNFVKKAKKNCEYSCYVILYKTEEYSKFKSLTIVDDNLAAVAVTNEGKIVSIIKNQDKKTQPIIDILLSIALANGGTYLECFGSYLCKKYISLGFFPVVKVKFDRKYAPKDWDYEKFGEQDIYFCCRYLDIDKMEKEVSNINPEKIFNLLDKSIPIMDYKSAEKYCLDILKRKLNINGDDKIFCL